MQSAKNLCDNSVFPPNQTMSPSSSADLKKMSLVRLNPAMTRSFAFPFSLSGKKKKVEIESLHQTRHSILTKQLYIFVPLILVFAEPAMKSLRQI